MSFIRLTLNQARHHRLLLGANGRPVDLSTVIRWGDRGVGGVKLALTRVGGRLYTTEADIQEFISRLNAARSAPATQQRLIQIKAARERLQQDEIC